MTKEIGKYRFTLNTWSGWFDNMRDKDDPEDTDDFWVWQFHLLPFIMSQRDMLIHNSMTLGWLFWTFRISWTLLNKNGV